MYVYDTYTQRNLFGILLNQPEIRLDLSFSNRFGTKRTSVWIQINRKIVNAIWFRVDLVRFRKDFSVCSEIFWQTIRQKFVFNIHPHAIEANTLLALIRGCVPKWRNEEVTQPYSSFYQGELGIFTSWIPS